MKPVTQILQTQYPLIQAPMSWVTDARLVAAVSNAGGLGVLGPNAGQTTITDDPIETAERMREQIRRTRELSDRSFGINILTPATHQTIEDVPFTAALLTMAYEENIRYFAVVGTAHQALFDSIHAHDGVVIFRPLTPTVAQMQTAEAYGADLLVATGSDEGGVLPRQDYGTFTVVPAMVDAVSLPVLAAGGINDRRGVNAAFALGAQGVYIGTRFLMTKESPMADNAKQAVITAHFENLHRVSATQRSLDTTAGLRYAQVYEKQHDPTRDHQISINGGLRPGMLLGDFDQGIISVNTGVDVIQDIPSVAALVNGLMTDRLSTKIHHH